MFVWIPRFSYTIGCADIDGDGNINDDVSIDSVPTECLGYKIEGASDLNIETPGAIDIKFISKDVEKETYTNNSPTYTIGTDGMPTADRSPSNWYTHPAFWSDNNGNGVRESDEELSGIWVGKFETSVNNESNCYGSLINGYEGNNCLAENEDVTPRILPDVLSLIEQNVYNQYETAKKFKADSIYRLSTGADSHMMKNSEWGAVAYLSQSIYGKYGNENFDGIDKNIYLNDSGTGDSVSRYTGRSVGEADGLISYNTSGTYEYNVPYYGTGASTTGNIYGIYDMVGGAEEYVMGYYTGASTVFGGRDNNGSEMNNSGFTNETKPHIKYFNGYVNNEILTKSNEVIGHATVETKGWYSNDYKNLTSSSPWLVRGGSYDNAFIGIFNTSNSYGIGTTYSSFRTVLSTIK